MNIDKLGLPWELGKSVNGTYNVYHPGFDVPLLGEVDVTCSLHGMDEAQARLMAAAPELAEALTLIMEFGIGKNNAHLARTALKKSGWAE